MATDGTIYTNGVRVTSASPTDTNPLNDTAYIATTVKEETNGNGGGKCETGKCGGGGSTPLTPDYCPEGDFSPSYYDKSCGEADIPTLPEHFSPQPQKPETVTP
ncbi:MAG: hypothetical protein LBD75_06470 [Candidatus Peribacteria bacterium]|jgi:hypothetical protein|nr:hypothetical protein [Candidatus Peribacteria bacterium]